MNCGRECRGPVPYRSSLPLSLSSPAPHCCACGFRGLTISWAESKRKGRGTRSASGLGRQAPKRLTFDDDTTDDDAAGPSTAKAAVSRKSHLTKRKRKLNRVSSSDDEDEAYGTQSQGQNQGQGGGSAAAAAAAPVVPEADEGEDDEVGVVKRILSHDSDAQQYLIEWEDGPNGEVYPAEWIDEDNLQDGPLLTQFLLARNHSLEAQIRRTDSFQRCYDCNKTLSVDSFSRSQLDSGYPRCLECTCRGPRGNGWDPRGLRGHESVGRPSQTGEVHYGEAEEASEPRRCGRRRLNRSRRKAHRYPSTDESVEEEDDDNIDPSMRGFIVPDSMGDGDYHPPGAASLSPEVTDDDAASDLQDYDEEDDSDEEAGGGGAAFAVASAGGAAAAAAAVSPRSPATHRKQVSPTQAPPPAPKSKRHVQRRPNDPVQCRAIKRDGERCKVMSSWSFESASVLRKNGNFCGYHVNWSGRTVPPTN